MKKIKFLLSSLCFALAMTTVGAQDVTNPNTAFFVQSAATAKLKALPNKPNTFQLTITKAPSSVIYFTDRPVRQHGLITVNQFMGFWQKGFKNNPPNVAINADYTDLKSKKIRHTTFIGTISHPIYHPNQSMTYTLVLEKNQKPVYENLGHTVLFFDDIPFNPGGY